MLLAHFTHRHFGRNAEYQNFAIRISAICLDDLNFETFYLSQRKTQKWEILLETFKRRCSAKIVLLLMRPAISKPGV